VNAATVAVKVAVVAPAATVTEEGVVTLELLSDSATAAPPEGAAAFNVTVQEAEPAVVNEEGEQLSAVGTTVAGRLTAITPPVAVVVRALPAAEALIGPVT
jgi:hypothetical protein